MLKRIISALLLFSICISLSSCALIEWMQGDMHGELEQVQTGILEYRGKKYYSAGGVLDRWKIEDDVEIAWSYNFPFTWKFSYFAPTAEDPKYIFTGVHYSDGVFLREDFDYKNQIFVLEGTDTEISLRSVFERVSYTLPEDYIGNYAFKLYMKEDPRLFITCQCSWYEGKWYCIRDDEFYLISDSFVEILKNKGVIPSDSDNRTPTDGLEGVDKFRPDYALGSCKNLSGDVSVVLFFMNDDESKWTNYEIENFEEKYVSPAFGFLEKEAKKYGVALNFKVQETFSDIYYEDDVITDIKAEGFATTDVFETAAKALGYTSDTEMTEALKTEYGTDEVICITVFNKDGVGYALNPRRGSGGKTDEHTIIFAQAKEYVSTDIVYTTLCLYGAESLKNTMWRRYLAKPYSGDIMYTQAKKLKDNQITELTAFYIGWTDKIPDVMFDENW